MSELIGSPPQENLLHQEDDMQANFHIYLPNSTLFPLKAGDYDGGLRKHFKMDETYDEFVHYAVYHHDLSFYTFASVDAPTDYSEAESEMYFLDRRHKRIIAGQGHLAVYLPKYKDDKLKPIINGTETSFFMRKKGFGLRRLETMNAFTRTFYDEPLLSTEIPTDAERRLWEELVQQGKAEKISNNEFSFI